MEKNYKMTGNNIPINEQEILSFVKAQLEEYNKLIKDSIKPDFDPINNPIIYKTSDGKIIQVPKETQNKAISEWNNSNQFNGLVTGYETINSHTDINHNNTDLGLHNQDAKFTSSIRPFDRFDSFNMPNSSQMLSDRTFALDNNNNPNNLDNTVGNFGNNIGNNIGNNNNIGNMNNNIGNMNNNITNETHNIIPSNNLPNNLPNNKQTTSPQNDNNIEQQIFNEWRQSGPNNPIIIEKHTGSNKNIYYILLLLIIVVGGLYYLKHK